MLKMLDIFIKRNVQFGPVAVDKLLAEKKTACW